MKKRLITALMHLFAALPLPIHRFNAYIVSFIARYIARYRYSVVKDNVEKAFPEKSHKEHKRIINDFYHHFGQIVCEMIWFGGCSEKRLHRSHIVQIVNPEEANRLHDIAKGTIVLCSHNGNWELYGGIPCFNYTDSPFAITYDNASVVYRKLRNPMWDEIFQENRKAPHKNYEHLVESSNVMRHILTHMDNKMFHLMITDQWPYFTAPSYIMVDFMGRKTRTMSGGAAIAKKYHLAVTYLSITRDKHKKHYIYEFKTICDDAATLSVQEIMDQYYRLLEEDIRKDPGNYLWSHKRWKNID